MTNYSELAATSDARTDFANHSVRFYWAGPLANGAALVAAAGLISNVSNPDAAITSLTIPLCCFVVGGMLGFVSLSEARACAALSMLRTQLTEIYRAESISIERAVALRQISALNLEPLKIIFPNPNELETELRQLWIGLKTNEANVWKKAEENTKDATEKLAQQRIDWNKSEVAARWAGLASAWICGLGLVVALLAHSFGYPLQPTPTHPANLGPTVPSKEAASKRAAPSLEPPFLIPSNR